MRLWFPMLVPAHHSLKWQAISFASTVFNKKSLSRQNDHQKMRAKLTVLANSIFALKKWGIYAQNDARFWIRQHCQNWGQNRLTLVNSIGQKWTNFTIHPLDKPTNPLPNRAEKALYQVQILSPRLQKRGRKNSQERASYLILFLLFSLLTR